MPYVKRNQFGQIEAVFLANEPGLDFVEPGSPELLSFAESMVAQGNAFTQADRDFVRVIEDIIYLLIDKSILRLTDLPLAVQHKLSVRRSLRGQQGDLSGIVQQSEEMPLL